MDKVCVEGGAEGRRARQTGGLDAIEETRASDTVRSIGHANGGNIVSGCATHRFLEEELVSNGRTRRTRGMNGTILTAEQPSHSKIGLRARGRYRSQAFYAEITGEA
jgi:hypothetical protein